MNQARCIQITPSPLDGPIAWMSRSERVWPLLATGAALAVYLLSLSPHWRIGEDAGLYLNLARNLAEGKGYTLAGLPHIHVPPGFPVMLAGMMALGLDSFLALNAAMALVGLATAGVTYLLMRQLVHKHWALVLTVVLALTNEYVQRSGEILSDMPSLLIVTTVLWLYMRGLRADRPSRTCWEIASILMVSLCWLRLAAVPLVLGAGMGLVLSARGARRRACLNLVIIILGLAITGVVFYMHYQAHRVPEASSYASWLSQLATGQIDPLASLSFATHQAGRLVFAQRMPVFVVVLIMVLPMAAALWQRGRARQWLGALVIVGYLGGLCFISQKVRTRYLLLLAPLLLLFLAEGYAILGNYLASRRWLPAKLRPLNPLPQYMLAVVLAMNLVLVARAIHQKHQEGYQYDQQKSKWAFIEPTLEFLRGQPPGTILASQPVGYLSRRPCPMLSLAMTQSDPSPKQVFQTLAKLDIRYVVLDDSNRDQPFYQAIGRNLESSGCKVWSLHGSGKLPAAEVYQVEPEKTTD